MKLNFKQLFLIPLLLMATSTTAWGATHEAGTFSELQSALAAAANGDEIKLTADINYGQIASYLDITKSITLNGQGHSLIGGGKRPGNTQYATVWINLNGANDVDVTIKDIKIINTTKRASQGDWAIQSRGHLHSLTLQNVYLESPSVPLQIGGNHTGLAYTSQVTIEDSYLKALEYYCLLSWNKFNLTASNSTFEGWCGIYFKGVNGSIGTRGSVVNAENCSFNCPNYNSGTSNSFACFPMEDDGITLNLHNCGMNIEQIGDQNQALMTTNNNNGSRREQPIVLNISGDNSHFNTAGGLNMTIQNLYLQGTNKYEPYGGIDVTITGGTYSVNPAEIVFYDQWVPVAEGNPTHVTLKGVTIPDGYEVSEINTTQSGVGTTLYRVRKEITSSTELNDNGGANETTEIKVESDVTLANETTTAKYVEVTGSGVTVTIPEGKTLEISNGMDITDGAQVVIQPGSIVAVGNGGVISQDASNIVIETNETGAASFLLNPEVIINTTPVITIKMITHVGKDGDDYSWHRFACPVSNISSFTKSVAEAGTWIQGWNYSTNQWENIGGLSDMQPFHGYALTHNQADGTEVVYSFTGELAGNINSTLDFSRRGYNFFGNSYAGYMDVLQILNKLNLDAIDGSVWMWNSESQTFTGVPVQTLREHPERFSGTQSWKKEVAPMQTFILRWMNGSDAPNGEVSYADAVWSNPRYSAFNGTMAPARQLTTTVEDNAFFRIVIKDASGKSDCVEFTEDVRFDDTYESGYDASKYMNERALNIFCAINEENYSSVVTNNLQGKGISIQTLDEISYTMSFENVEGAPYAIKDTQTGIVTFIQEGNTYVFTAQPNATTEGRFQIVERNQVPTDIENVATASNESGIYTLLGQYIGDSTLWNSLPNGVYIVNGVKLVK